MAHYYPTKSNKIKTIYNKLISGFNKNSNADIRLEPLMNNLVSVENDEFNTKVYDGWSNPVASINAHNSLMQHSFFTHNKISYSELCMLSCDDLINNAIQTITRECLNKWGEIKITNSDIKLDEQEIIINKINQRFLELDINNICYNAIQTSLIYGGVGIYIDVGDEDKANELLLKSEFFKSQKILKSMKVVEPYLFSPQRLNVNNPLSDNFMKPDEWYISGVGSIHASRLYTLIFFDVPNLLKPVYNCLGISLCQLMKDKVKSAETIRQCLTDLMLRFKTDIIKTPSLLGNPELLKDRIDLYNASKNNLGTLVLSDQEEFINSVTAITGLDKIQSQAFENVASSARLPAVKLLGLTPSGFNATGEFDLKNYYDVIRGYQNTTIKPFIDKIIDILSLELGYSNIATFEFNPLEKINEFEKAQWKNSEIDAMIKMIDAGIITNEDAFQELQNNNIISKGLTFNDDIDDISQIEIEGLE